jgi:DoxX
MASVQEPSSPPRAHSAAGVETEYSWSSASWPNSLTSVGLLVGRIFLSLIFISSGTMKIFHWSETEQMMATRGMVAIPFFLVAAMLFEICGGL